MSLQRTPKPASGSAFAIACWAGSSSGGNSRSAPIADFVCIDRKLIVELDGGQHADNPADERRTRFLELRGYRVIRFWNPDVLSNTDGVLEMILLELEKAPHPSAV